MRSVIPGLKAGDSTAGSPCEPEVEDELVGNTIPLTWLLMRCGYAGLKAGAFTAGSLCESEVEDELWPFQSWAIRDFRG
jgi:hypothetical protein